MLKVAKYIILFFMLLFIMFSWWPEKRWFKEKSQNGEYSIEGIIESSNFIDESLKKVKIKIIDNNLKKELISYETYVDASKPSKENYNIICTDEYIKVTIISNSNYYDYISDYNDQGDVFYYEDLEKINNQ